MAGRSLPGRAPLAGLRSLRWEATCNWVPEAAGPAQPRVPRQAQHVKSHFWMHWCKKWTTSWGLCCSQVRDWPCLAHTSTLLDCHSWRGSLLWVAAFLSPDTGVSRRVLGAIVPAQALCSANVFGTCEHASRELLGWLRYTVALTIAANLFQSGTSALCTNCCNFGRPHGLDLVWPIAPRHQSASPFLHHLSGVAL